MKKIIFLLFLSGAVLTSCSDNDSSDDDGNPPSDTVLLKTLIETFEGEDLVINYTYSGNRLIGSSDSDGYSEVFTYTGDLLTMIEEFEDGVLDYRTELAYDANNRLITETITFGAQNVEVNQFTYNADGTITKQEAGENAYIYTYDQDGNRIAEEDIDGGQDYTYTYDSKNGALKNIHQREVFELLGYYAYNNNLLDEINTGGVAFADEASYTYEYNNLDYPESAVETVTLDGIGEEEVYTLQFIYE